MGIFDVILQPGWKRNQNMTPTFPWNLEFCFYIFFTENQISIVETRNTLILHMPPPANIIKKGILGGRVKKKEKKKSIGGRLISYFVKPSFLFRISSTDISFCSISSFL